MTSGDGNLDPPNSIVVISRQVSLFLSSVPQAVFIPSHAPPGVSERLERDATVACSHPRGWHAWRRFTFSLLGVTDELGWERCYPCHELG